MTNFLRPLLVLVVFALLAASALAAVTRIEISERTPFAEGQAIGERGPYQTLRGKAYFAVDPKSEANGRVIDLELAPRNAQGLVEFSTDVELLCPVDLAKASGRLLYDVNNRGNKICLGQFDTGADNFLARQGFIVVWCGWIAETQPGNGRLRLEAPVPTERGEPLRGPVRAEMVPDKETDRLSIAQWANQGCYLPSERGLASATLTWRQREKDARVPIPRGQWKLEVQSAKAGETHGQLPQIDLVLAGGFHPGYIYELVYEGEGSLVQGAGLAAIRDLVSHLKYERSDRNPLRGADGQPIAKYTYGFGVSQSGRCLRQFLYDGFNADEQGRQVFDGLMPHVAGAGLGFFNHRFASPTRHNAQHDSHLYPADMFPFTYGDERNPFTGEEDSILRRARQSQTVPKIMHTQTSSEYWHRSGSLVHTDPLGERDAELPPEVRIYAYGGCQHGAGSGLSSHKRTTGQLPSNPSDYRPLNRALLLALDAWVSKGVEPPPSVYPRLADKTLVPWPADKSGWRPLPGVRYPEVIQQPEWLDRGPEFAMYRRTTIEPPVSRGNYVVRVPAYEPDDNERGTLQLPSVAVPLATYASWNLRHREIGAENELLSLNGAYIPFCQTVAEREQTGDPRPSIAERYPDRDEYCRQFLESARRLVDQRYLLAEELPREEQLADQLWDSIVERD